jgi:TolA-binding protein
MKKIIALFLIMLIANVAVAADQSVVIDKSQFIEHVIKVKKLKDENENLNEQIVLYRENTERRKKLDELKSKKIKELEGTITDLKQILEYEEQIKEKQSEKIDIQSKQIVTLTTSLEDEKKKVESETKWSTAKNIAIAVEAIIAIALYSRIPKGVPINVGQMYNYE